MNEVEITGRKIGGKHPCFIIAEAGSNHNGKIELAKKLIDEAAKAGADAVKFQLFRAQNLYVGDAGCADYLGKQTSIYDIIKSMEMPYEWLPELVEYCKKRKIIFFGTAFDEKSADFLDPYTPVHKISSYELNHIPLIKHIAAKGKPLIMSTGACTMQEIREAVAAAHSVGNDRIMIMQCTAKYPAPLSSLNVRVIETLKKEFGVPVGLSDHSAEPLSGPLAAACICGANFIEKHFTLDRGMEGPDHKSAVEPQELKEMIGKIRAFEGGELSKEEIIKVPGVDEALGSPDKKITEVEKELADFAKRWIHAVRDIKKGELLTLENIAILRPGKAPKGMEPKHWEEIVNKKKAKRAIPQWKGIQPGDLE